MCVCVCACVHVCVYKYYLGITTFCRSGTVCYALDMQAYTRSTICTLWFVWLQERGMKRECSWDNAAQQYEQIFEWSITDPPYCR